MLGQHDFHSVVVHYVVLLHEDNSPAMHACMCHMTVIFAHYLPFQEYTIKEGEYPATLWYCVIVLLELTQRGMAKFCTHTSNISFRFSGVNTTDYVREKVMC